MSEEKLTKGICTLAGKIKPGEETSQLRLILFDYISNVKERENALDLFDVLKESQEITTQKVNIIYEILMLMGKKKLWTDFCKDTLIEIKVPYDVKKNSICFTKFRLMMIEIGNKLTSKMVTYLKKVYDVDEDFSSEWMLLLHLEQHLHVEEDVPGSIESFGKNLRTAKCTRGAKIVEEYVTQTTSAITECDFKPNTSKDSNGTKPK
ncbi:uncharacterized protein LOC117116330, partial [Anneissia japonica]|uniref:uncharacterized protein LOC117116330 n=1 Tax=Anneissia japonica TaxID=1529436 RepID=UPI001425A3C8